MSARHHQAEKDKKRQEQEKLQMILNRLLKEEENKYCADCEAKGPRWASWNLGVFLCIRCAGIHRNLGVHLSRVKSVNLDTWTPEQVQHMRVIGNCVGKAVYEASLPDHFRRPQTDSALEAFIRGKYEHKRYLMKDYVPAKIDARDLLTSDEYLRPLGIGGTNPSSAAESGSKTAKKATLNLEPKPASVQSKRDSAGSTGKERVRRRSSNSTSNQQPQHAKADGHPADAHSASVATALNDLVDLDLGGSSGWITASAPNLVSNPGAAAGGLDDLLGLNVASTQPTQAQQPQTTNGLVPNSSSNGLSELSQDLLFGTGGGAGTTESGANTNGAGSKKTKNDILALYGSGGGGQQAQAPMMGGLGFNMPPTPQMPFAGMQNQMMMGPPANNWMMPEATAGFGKMQAAPLLVDPSQQSAPGFVATPFGYVPVAQTQQPMAQFGQMPAMAAATGVSNGPNVHLQSIQQQLASLQLQRSQQPPASFAQPQQDTLATNLWH